LLGLQLFNQQVNHLQSISMFLRYIGYIFWLVTIELVGLDESGKGERGVGMFEKDYGGVKFDDLEPPPTPGGLLVICVYLSMV